MLYGFRVLLGRPFVVRYFEGSVMSNEEIRDIYNSHLNMTLAELARITGKTVPELKKILMENTK